MIRVNDIPLLCPSDPDAERYPVNLSDLLFSPGTSLPDSVQGTAPPPMPPYRVEYAPGTLYWPQGASRFAVGQYLVTDLEAQQIREIVLEDPITNHLTLKLGGEGTGQDEITFQMHLLHLIPLQLDRAEEPVAERAVYLMILVDYRYFFQTLAPDWEIDDTTTWTDLDTDILAFLPAGSTADAVDADYLQPGTALAPPPLASDGVIGWAGPLLDAACLASGRRFVANTNGTFTLQSFPVARPAHNASEIANIPYRRFGGLLAFPPEDEATQKLVIVPDSLLFVFPEESGGTTEVSPYTKQVTFDSVRSAAQMNSDVPLREGELVIPTTLWCDNVNTADLDAWAIRFATDWYGFLSAMTVQVYSGAVDFPPDGFTDVTVWKVCADDVWTRVYRGLFNPRPHVVCGYSGVDPPTPTPPGAVYVYNTALAPLTPEQFDHIRADNATGVYFEALPFPFPSTWLALKLTEAQTTQWGVVTDQAQTWDGLKTLWQTLTMGDGTGGHPDIDFIDNGTGGLLSYLRWSSAAWSLGAFFATLTGNEWLVRNTASGSYTNAMRTRIMPTFWALEADDGSSTWEQLILGSFGGLNVGALTAVLNLQTSGLTINSTAGFSGTGGGGDTFLHGICTAAGGGGGGISITIPGPSTVTGTAFTFNAGTGISITSPGAGQITFTNTAPATGTVTSVAMTVPGFLSVAGSPITTSGTLAVTLATQSANTVFAGPTSGGAAAPTFRSLIAADITCAASKLLGNDAAGGGVAKELGAGNGLTFGTGTLDVFLTTVIDDGDTIASWPANGTYQALDNTCSITVTAGKWAFWAMARAVLQFSAGSNAAILMRVQNTTTSTTLENSYTVASETALNYQSADGITLPFEYTASGTETIRLEFTTIGGTTWTARNVTTARLYAIKIGS